jgi:hypothetical protein
VISCQASQEERLKAEIREYIVTERIEHQLERLLENIQAAMESGGGHEVGVWVSGFYGSGKSSFRLHKPTTKTLLSTVAARFPAAVVMLDLASEQIAGATLAEVSTVLYYKVLQYAGYSRNLKVAALERKLKKEGRFAEFEALFHQETGETWPTTGMTSWWPTASSLASPTCSIRHCSAAIRRSPLRAAMSSI